MALFEILNLDCGKSKGKKRGLLPEAQIRASEIMKGIQITPFIVKDAELDFPPYKLGYIEFETVDVSALPC